MASSSESSGCARVANRHDARHAWSSAPVICRISARCFGVRDRADDQGSRAGVAAPRQAQTISAVTRNRSRRAATNARLGGATCRRPCGPASRRHLHAAHVRPAALAGRGCDLPVEARAGAGPGAEHLAPVRTRTVSGRLEGPAGRRRTARWVGGEAPVPAFRPVVSSPPPAEPDVRVSPHPALHEHLGWSSFMRAPAGRVRATAFRRGGRAERGRWSGRRSARSTGWGFVLLGSGSA
jgi:hypothetical protein